LSPLRILHFVTGGFSGATQVAVDLCRAAHRSGDTEVLLALRRKPSTDPARVTALRAEGLDVQVMPGWSHVATILALRKLAQQWRPDILVAHGFSEHIWGRYAGLLAGVPHLVHVEHNSRERYTRWRLAQALWLARRSAATVGVSEGVRHHLLELGFPAANCVAIPNGIDMQRFPEALQQPWAEREDAVVMASRFGRQKDHATLVHALALLGEQAPRLYLAGGGKQRQRNAIAAQVRRLGLESQVQFMGQVADVPDLLRRQRIFVLSTHYEGMPLALVEAMAAGCACIASDVVGAREVLEHGRTGLLVPEGNAEALAQAIAGLRADPERAEALGRSARQYAVQNFNVVQMHARYDALFHRVQASLPVL
jgi:glycosyltransferase involved in cell wall biosynthesis